MFERCCLDLEKFNKFIDILGKPINFNLLLASFFTSLLLLVTNFFPLEYLERLHLEKFLDNYNFIVLIVFFVSFFLLVINFNIRHTENKKDAEFEKIYSKHQDELFQDEEALKILDKLYSKHPEAVYLPLYNQKVKLLEQYGLITKASNQALVNMSNPKFPYILQPVAEDKLKDLYFGK